MERKTIDLSTGEEVTHTLTPEEEAEFIAQNTPSPEQVSNNVKNQINSMERVELMPRATREFMLTFLELNFTPAQLERNKGYTKIKAFDTQISDLRKLL